MDYRDCATSDKATWSVGTLEDAVIDWSRIMPPPGFRVLPRRWVIERTLSWLGQNRRLSKDYELLTDTSEAMIHAAMTRLMVRRLAQT